MKKDNALNIKEALPHLFKWAGEVTKSSVESLKSEEAAEKMKDTVEHAGGTAGLIIRFFGKPLIDKHYENVKAKKLENFGYDAYLSAALKQAEISLKAMENRLSTQESPNKITKHIQSSINKQEREVKTSHKAEKFFFGLIDGLKK